MSNRIAVTCRIIARGTRLSLRGACRLGLLGLASLLLATAPAQRVPASPQPKASRKAASPAVAADAKSVEALTATALRSVVVITHHGRDGKEDGVGAGFVVGTNGLIATSFHVIGESRPITVRLADGRSRPVLAIHAWDRHFDLAVLRIDPQGEVLPVLPLGDSDALKQGAGVIALGNPVGLEHSVVQGVLSARRELEGVTMLQVAIPIEPGNSGGPLLDLRGRVQGILTLKSAMTPNLGFAMPVNLLKSLLEQPNPVTLNRWLAIGALNPKEWSPLFGGVWSQKAGRVLVEGAGQGFGGRALCLSQQETPARPFDLSVLVRLDDESGAAGLVFGSDGHDQHYGFYPSAGQLRLTRFDGPTVYTWTILKQVPSPAYRRGDWNHLRVRLEPDRILCYVNGQLVIESEDGTLKERRVGLAKFRDTRAEFRDFQAGTNLLPRAAFITSSPAPLPEPLRRSIEEASTDPAAGRTEEAALLAELQKGGNASREALNQHARQLELRAHQARRLALLLHHRTVLAELTRVLEGKEESRTDLFHAALLVARLDNPDLEIDLYRDQLSGMAEEIRARLDPKSDGAARLKALRDYLFAENGYHGSRSDYYNRANSYVNEVIDDREGLPITLSVVFLALAERLDIQGVTGLPLPGQFMVRYVPGPDPGHDQIIDVFGGGQILTREAAQDRIQQVTGEGFRDSDYRSATKREIIVRILRNLISVAERKELNADPTRYLDLILALTPDSVGDRLSRARLRLQGGDIPGAKEDFKWLLDQQPASVDLERIAELYRSL